MQDRIPERAEEMQVPAATDLQFAQTSDRRSQAAAEAWEFMVGSFCIPPPPAVSGATESAQILSELTSATRSIDSLRAPS